MLLSAPPDRPAIGINLLQVPVWVTSAAASGRTCWWPRWRWCCRTRSDVSRLCIAFGGCSCSREDKDKPTGTVSHRDSVRFCVRVFVPSGSKDDVVMMEHVMITAMIKQSTFFMSPVVSWALHRHLHFMFSKHSSNEGWPVNCQSCFERMFSYTDDKDSIGHLEFVRANKHVWANRSVFLNNSEFMDVYSPGFRSIVIGKNFIH